MKSNLKEFDSEVFGAIVSETKRQAYGLELIASENFVSENVLAAMGSPLTNKYAEGYPGRRYYGGCEYVDVVERIAIDRAKELFGAEAANVQPHSGSQANMAVYFAELVAGDVFLAMDLAHGGHLTHGSPVSFSGSLFKAVHYGVSPDTHRIDMDNVAKLAREHKPKLIMIGASAYPRFYDFAKFREIADEIGAVMAVDMAHFAGLVAAGEHPSPVPYADYCTSTTHKTLRGPRSGMVVCKEAKAKKLNSKVFPGIQGGPLMHVIAAKAVAFKEAMTPEFKAYQKRIKANAQALAEAVLSSGYQLISGGTANHLMLLDLRPKNITGKQAEIALDRAGITVNKNMIPFDPQPPTVASGIRIGTPALTTRGMNEGEMKYIASLIDEVLTHIDDEATIERVRGKVRELAQSFPLYKERLECYGE